MRLVSRLERLRGVVVVVVVVGAVILVLPRLWLLFFFLSVAFRTIMAVNDWVAVEGETYCSE